MSQEPNESAGVSAPAPHLADEVFAKVLDELGDECAKTTRYFVEGTATHHHWDSRSQACKMGATAIREQAAAPASVPSEPDEYQPHTGDDDLLDALTGARAALETLEFEENPTSDDFDEAIADALDELTKADGIRVRELKSRAASVPPEGIAAPRLAGPVDYERVMKVMPQHCPHRDRDGLVCQPCAYSTITALSSQLEAAQKERDEAIARAEQAEAKASK